MIHPAPNADGDSHSPHTSGDDRILSVDLSSQGVRIHSEAQQPEVSQSLCRLVIASIHTLFTARLNALCIEDASSAEKIASHFEEIRKQMVKKVLETLRHSDPLTADEFAQRMESIVSESLTAYIHSIA